MLNISNILDYSRRVYEYKFGGEICNKKVIDSIWRNMPALGLCTAQRPGAGIFRLIQSITYN